MSSIVQTLENLLGADSIVPWDSIDPLLQTQLSQASSERTIECAVYPKTIEALSEVVACAAQNCWPLLPFGQGSKLNWGGLAQGIKVAVSTARLDRLIEHASGDLTVTAEAGFPLATLQQTLATAGQFLAVDPAYADRATLGGLIATADTGALRQRYGGIRDMLIGLTFVRSDGKLTKAGGRVVKNVAGYDLMKLLTGSYGTLGIVTQATFRIYPIPETSATVILSGEADDLAKVATILLASALTPTAIELLTPELVKELAIGSGFGLVGRFQSSEVSVVQQAEQLLQMGESVGLKAVQIRSIEEQALWQRLSESIESQDQQAAITCKIGIVPTQAVNFLSKLEQIAPSGLGTIHAGSGLGLLKLPLLSIEELQLLRQFCQTQVGFFTILAAPVELKRSIDPWGYAGNALPVMQRLKTQFDPDHLFSPHRFVGGI